MKQGMLMVTRLYLHNWQRYQNVMIEGRGSIFVAGPNTAGKTTLLDALQVLLIADAQAFRFNRAAQEGRRHTGGRTLDSYVRGKLQERGYLREKGAIAYLALELTDTSTSEPLTIGACIEAFEGRQPIRTHFILPKTPLESNLFFDTSHQPLSRAQLKKALQSFPRARTYDEIGEYQLELRQYLGGLSVRFFDLFLRALSYEPIENIPQFVEKWVLEPQQLQLEALRMAAERLNDLYIEVEVTRQKISELGAVIEAQQAAQTALHQAEVQRILAAQLRYMVARQVRQTTENHLKSKQQDVYASKAILAEREIAVEHIQQALDECRVRLSRLGDTQRRQYLEQQRITLEGELQRRRQGYEQAKIKVQSVAEHLSTLLGFSGLLDNEEEKIRSILQAFPAILDTVVDLQGFLPTLQQVIRVREQVQERLQAQDIRLDDRHHTLLQKSEKLTQSLTDLRSSTSRPQSTYPPNVLLVQRRLGELLGVTPPLLCELLRIPDERWQNAVEALLGKHRFELLVGQDHYRAAVHLLESARQEGIRGVILLDVDRISADGERAAQPQSLAEQVETDHPGLRIFVDTLLGNIITCNAIDELDRYQQAVTPEVVFRQWWSTEALPEESFTPRFIGERALPSQIAIFEQEQAEIHQQLAQAESEQAQSAPALQNLKQLQRLESLVHQQILTLEDEQPVRVGLAAIQDELEKLDVITIRTLEAEIETHQERLKQVQRQRDEALREQDRAERAVEMLKADLISAQGEEGQSGENWQHLIAATSPLVTQRAETLYASLDPHTPFRDHLQIAEEEDLRCSQIARSKQQEFLVRGTQYNTKWSFSGNAFDSSVTSYQQEQDRLEATQLPRYAEEIATVRREADEELRQHVIYQLRELILTAQDKLKRINQVLKQAPLKQKYQFVWEEDEDLHDYYRLIMDAPVVGHGSLFDTQFYRDHHEAIDQFIVDMIAPTTSETLKGRLARLHDYRSYLGYDIEIIHENGARSRLSKIMDASSGGEMQTAFYVIIAASFAQLYDISQYTGRSAIRLIAFDEAFSKMDESRIQSTLQIFQQFQLQVIAAAPLERAVYLAPYMGTNLIVSPVAGHVKFKPFFNTHAFLEGSGWK